MTASDGNAQTVAAGRAPLSREDNESRKISRKKYMKVFAVVFPVRADSCLLVYAQSDDASSEGAALHA